MPTQEVDGKGCRMRWRTTAVVLVTVAAVLPVAGAAVADHLPPGGTFVDDDGGPFEGWVEAVAAAGVTSGCDTDRFCPTEVVTRGQVAQLVATAAGLLPAGAEVPDAFVDDDGGPFERAIDALAHAAVVTGCADGAAGPSYCPTAPVSRAQLATILVRALDLGPLDAPDAFVDDDGSPHEGDVDRLAASGTTGGCDDGARLFCPQARVTRGQVAAFLGRALGLEEHVPPARPVPVDAPGNPDGDAPVPAWADRVDTSTPDRVVGRGDAASCTGDAVVAAVARGGLITFDCGPEPVTIPMTEPARVFNDASAEVVLDGGGLVTLDGGGTTRLVHMDTCDPDLVWTTPHCDDQDHPRLTLQGLTLTGGRVGGTDLAAGGGAVYARGGRLRIVDSRFEDNRCAATGPDVGGGAVRAFDQWQDLPVAVTRSSFVGNRCSNGGALSSIGVSWEVRNSVLTGNEATGEGANPARSGTPGGGNGGAIALDGNRFTLALLDVVMTDNRAPEGGGGVFFVSNDRTGTMRVDGSTLLRNVSDGFETAGYPGIFFLGAEPPAVTDSTVR